MAIVDIEYRLDGGEVKSANDADSPFTISDLINGKNYSVEMRLVDDQGNRSDWSNSATGVPVSGNEQPTILSLNGTELDSVIDISWTIDNGGAPITSIEYQVDSNGWFSTGSTSTTGSFSITGLTNGTSYDIQIRATNDEGTGFSLTITKTPQAELNNAPDPPTIDGINSGDGEMYIYNTLGGNGGSPITGLQFRVDGGSWNSVQAVADPLVASISNGTYDVQIRAVNAVGVSTPSNTVTGVAESELDFLTYLAMDTDLFSDTNNLTFQTNELGNQNIIHFTDRENDIPDEPWERLDSGSYSNPLAAWIGGLSGSFTVDHEGYLRIYYILRFEHDGQRIQASAMQRSTDGGVTWNKVRDNLATHVVDDPQSNLIYINPPSGFNDLDFGSHKVHYDSRSGKYLSVSEWDGDSGYWVSASNDGKTFPSPVKVLDNVAGDDGFCSIFYDESISKYVMVIRARGRQGLPDAPDGGPPTPWQDTRFLTMATCSTYNGSFDLIEENSFPKYVIDPADIWNYGDGADDPNDWKEITDGTCGDRWVPDTFTPKIRPDFQIAPLFQYKDYYITTPVTFFKDDEKSPYRNRDRTDGVTYPTWGISRSRESGWKFPDKNRSAVDLTPYYRVDTHPCNFEQGNSSIGKVASSYGFKTHSDKLFVVVTETTVTEEQRHIGENTDYGKEDTTAVHHTIQDRFAQLEAGGTEGYWEAPKTKVPTDTNHLYINSEGNVKVELLNAITNQPIDGFAKADANELTSDAMLNDATWNSGKSISDLRGQNVIVKIYVTNGKIYSFKFRD